MKKPFTVYSSPLSMCFPFTVILLEVLTLEKTAHRRTDLAINKEIFSKITRFPFFYYKASPPREFYLSFPKVRPLPRCTVNSKWLIANGSEWSVI